MNVLFVVPNAKGMYSQVGFPHVGIGYLMAVLREGGHTPAVIDMRLGYSRKDLEKRFQGFKPDLVAVTMMSRQHDVAYGIVRYLKKRGHKVVVGGPHISVYREKVLEDTPADFAIFGEGEYALLELCNGKPHGEIKGLVWRKGKRTIVNQPRPPLTDLDSLPFPAYDLFEIEKYSEKMLPITSSRGCPFRCIFCSIRLSMGRIWRPRSAENVVSEIAHWYAKGYRKFQFTDDNFTLDMGRVSKLCDLILKKGLDIQWDLRNGVRADRVSLPLLRKMKKAGCFFVLFGVESANKDVLAAIKKDLDLKNVRNAVRMAKAAGLKVSASFIIGHPSETYDNFMESYTFAKSLHLDEVKFFNLMPYPGTELYDWVRANGRFLYEPDHYLNAIDSFTENPYFETPYFTEEERKKAFRLAESLVIQKLYRRDLGPLLGTVAWMLWTNKVTRAMEKKAFTFITSMFRK